MKKNQYIFRDNFSNPIKHPNKKTILNIEIIYSENNNSHLENWLLIYDFR